MNYTELPVGFAMALAQNRAALEKFGAMSDAQKQKLVDRAHTARSRPGRASRSSISAKSSNTSMSIIIKNSPSARSPRAFT